MSSIWINVFIPEGIAGNTHGYSAPRRAETLGRLVLAIDKRRYSPNPFPSTSFFHIMFPHEIIIITMGPRDWILRFRDDYKTRFFVRLGGNLEGGVKTEWNVWWNGWCIKRYWPGGGREALKGILVADINRIGLRSIPSWLIFLDYSCFFHSTKRVRSCIPICAIARKGDKDIFLEKN